MTNLQRLRLAAGLSQSQLASKSGVNVRMIQQYECKNRNINKAQFDTKQAELKSKIEGIIDSMNLK